MDEKKDVVIPEIKQLQILDQVFSKEEIVNTLNDIERLGREMEVGGQTSYQNKFFVLNPVEFPEGTSGKSRQAVFESAVRVDVLKGNLFEYKKMCGEMKILNAKMIRAQKKYDEAVKSGEEADILEAEGEIEILTSEIRQKELALENVQAKSKHVLRSIVDFYNEYQVNEQLCNELGFETSKDWNKLEVEDHYWRSVNNRKVQKAAAYAALGMNQQLGDSLPLQNNLNVQEIAFVRDKTLQELGVPIAGPQGQQAIEASSSGIPEVVRRGGPSVPPQSKDVWELTLNKKDIIMSTECPHKQGNECAFRPKIRGLCSHTYCIHLGLAIQK